MVAAASVLVACATGVDSADDPLGVGDSGGAVEASASGHDAGGGGVHDAAPAQDTGSPAEAGPTSDDAQADDAPTMDEAAAMQDSATIQDTGTTVPETSTGQDTGTTTGGQCSGAAKYDLEAVAEIASGTITLCLGGVCAAGQCCFEGLSPGNVCVAE
ncbi:MAG TPA: hypothetical protein VIJ22_18530 [Polyangiaceae bacterium]